MPTKYCECDCGAIIAFNRRFVRGHNTIRGNDGQRYNNCQCKVDGCKNKAYCRKMCEKHYFRWWRENKKANKQRLLLQTNK